MATNPAEASTLDNAEQDANDFGLSSLEAEEDMSFAELYKTLTINEDIILVIDAESEESLRKGLTTLKYKTNKSAREAGISFDSRTLEFKVLPFTKEEELSIPDVESKLKVQVYLKAKSGVKVHKIVFTDKEF